MFEVIGKNKEGRWIVRHPSGLECNGTWKSQEDAKECCDRWNDRKSSWDID
jgi:hypothetical protein